MIQYLNLDMDLRNNKLSNSYVFCGVEEALMQECIDTIKKKVLTGAMAELNFIQYDGLTASMDDVIGTCNTISFMAEKKVVLVYRANFLREEGGDKDAKKKNDALLKYMSNPNPDSILIIYCVLDDREKVSDKVMKYDKKTVVVKFDKLKDQLLERKVKALFDSKGKKIGTPQLKLFCDGVESNLTLIESEVEKLISYTYGRDITNEDIVKMLPDRADNDIFNLVEAISTKKVENSLEVLNELMFKGEKATAIIYMIERQFNLLLQIKYGMEEGKKKDEIVKDLKMNSYICEKMMVQSKKFTVESLRKAVSLCLEAEVTLKSSSTDSKTEMELLILGAINS